MGFDSWTEKHKLMQELLKSELIYVHQCLGYLHLLGLGKGKYGSRIKRHCRYEKCVITC